MTDNRYYWIKLKTDFFDSAAIDFLMSQKNGSQYVVLYQLLCLKTVNNSGQLASSLGEMIIPYDAEKISRDTRYFSVDTVRVALELFKKLGLVYVQEDGILRISDIKEMLGTNSEDHIRKLAAERQRRYKERKRLALSNAGDDVTSNVTDNSLDNLEDDVNGNVTMTLAGDGEIEIEKELEIEKGSLRERAKKEKTDCSAFLGSPEENDRIDYDEIFKAYNETCLAMPRCKLFTEERKKNIKLRAMQFGKDSILEVFQKASRSDFLNGENNRTFKASFDWIMNKANFVKILEGNYDNDKLKGKSQGGRISHDGFESDYGSTEYEEVSL